MESRLSGVGCESYLVVDVFRECRLWFFDGEAAKGGFREIVG